MKLRILLLLLAGTCPVHAQEANQAPALQQVQPLGSGPSSWLERNPASGPTVFTIPEWKTDPLSGQTILSPGTMTFNSFPQLTDAQIRELSDLVARRDALSPADAERLVRFFEEGIVVPLTPAPIPLTPLPDRPETTFPVVAATCPDGRVLPSYCATLGVELEECRCD